MTDYAKVNLMKRHHKAALTRAKNTGNPAKVIAAVRSAREDFDRHGWPDQWPLWAIAVRDLEYHEDAAIRESARIEADAWQ